jgi:Mrp family chromosome partitioning ATPase
MAGLLGELAATADAVVIDSPPLLAVADAGILASQVTGTVLVTHIGRTRLSALAQAAEVVNKAGGNLLGVVLNRLDISQNGYYSSYYSYYNYNYHYYHYSHYTDDTGPGGGHRAHAPRPWWQRVLRAAPDVSRLARRHGSPPGADQ